MDVTAPPILELGVVLLLAAAAGWIARRVRLPAVVGYLAVGLAISPFTPGYVADRTQLQLLADVGVVLLLFEVGIEIDLVRLRREHSNLVWAAPLQTIVTTIIAAAAALVAGLSPVGAGLIGLGVALSSSVVIVNITRSRRRTTDRDTEEALLGWSVLQDVTGVTVAIVLLATSLGGERPVPIAMGGLATYAVLVVAVAVLLPAVLRQLRAEHDLFLIVSVASGLAIAGIGSIVAHLPLALAAFVAGLAITEGPDAAEARRRLLPFRDLFAVLFFVAIGTLIDPPALSRGLGWVAFMLVLIVVAKVVVAYLLARLARLRARPVQLAIGLGQVGEFSFVLASVGLAAGVVPRELYAAVLASVAITIVASTVLVRLVGEPRDDLSAAPAA
jgi:CPA2 family monovalent cation:H+ antiporter-2